MQDGYVFVSDAEVGRMAAHLGMEVSAFMVAFAVRPHPTEESLVLEAREGRGCPLLTADRRCSVHAVKPAQCATWPFWTDMIEDEALWERSKSYCPGLDAPGGREYSRKEILQIAREKRGT